MPTKRKYRRCPHCGEMLPASDLKRAVGSKPAWGRQKVSCPSCGHVAMQVEFAEVEPPEGGEATGAVS